MVFLSYLLLGKTFVTGLASSFSEDYDSTILENHITKKEFKSIMVSINDLLNDFFPCPLCFCFGYFCCPCTLGLSFLLPNTCVKDAETELKALIKRINEKKLKSKKIFIALQI